MTRNHIFINYISTSDSDTEFQVTDCTCVIACVIVSVNSSEMAARASKVEGGRGGLHSPVVHCVVFFDISQTKTMLS